MTVEIPLTRGMVSLVDDSDADAVGQFSWSVKPGKKTTYAVRRVLASEGRGRMLESMHRYLTGWPLVDHVNGNGLDNRRRNLRLATDLQNLRNMRSRGGSSRFKGVCRQGSRWRATIRPHTGRQVTIGLFTCERTAAHAYDTAARENFGEFAALNFPLPSERGALDREP